MPRPIRKPHILRSGLNEFGDSEILIGNDWDIINEISIDSTLSRSLGSNSLKLTKDLVSGMGGIPFSLMMPKDTFPITPCSTYTFSFFMRSANGPAIILSKFDSSGF